jgi:hypothetical protein
VPVSFFGALLPVQPETARIPAISRTIRIPIFLILLPPYTLKNTLKNTFYHVFLY